MSFYAQFGEDRLLADHFDHKSTGFCVEVGALDGCTDSNTLYFEQQGWGCLLVEATPEMAAACRENRPKATVVECAVVHPDAPSQVTFQVAEDIKGLSSLAVDQHNADALKRYHGRVRLRDIVVNTKTLDAIFTEQQPPSIDFMTIDVEGQEWNVLQGFDLNRWQPKIVIVERNHHFPRWRMLRHFHQHAYKLQRTTGVNDWFIRTDGAALTFTYRVNLIKRYYLMPLPAWFGKQWRAFWQFVGRSARTARYAIQAQVKHVLIKIGLFERVKNWASS